MVISLVSAGLGIALLPISATAVRLENVAYIDIIDRLNESELTLVCHRIVRSEVLKVPYDASASVTGPVHACGDAASILLILHKAEEMMC